MGDNLVAKGEEDEVRNGGIVDKHANLRCVFNLALGPCGDLAEGKGVD